MSTTCSRFLSGILAAAACLLLAGCSTQIFDNLHESEANAVIAALMENGMAAEKRSGTEGTYSVFIDKADFARAVQVLESRALPRRRYDNLGQVFGKGAMFSTPMEEKARYLYAMQEDLAHTISLIDGVLAARVHLVLSEQDQLGRELQKPSAAVFINHMDDERHDPLMHRTEIRRLVAAAVPNLEEERIVVSFFPVDPRAFAPTPAVGPVWTTVMGVRVARESAGTLWYMLSGMIVFGVALAAGAFWFGQRRSIKN
jgi:type III secretion protein J